jgi:hypothetical protein
MKRALPTDRVVFTVVTTVNSIGEKIVALQTQTRGKIVFLMTACELSLQLFADLAALVGVSGMGVRLRGKTCPTLSAFQYAESGIKPTVTSISHEGKQNLLTAVHMWRTRADKSF